jgi:hypothetical protein
MMRRMVLSDPARVCRLAAFVVLILAAFATAACHPHSTSVCPGWHEGGGSCSAVADCSYAGDCIANHCVCDAPYTGANCAGLALGRSSIALHTPDDSFWDGSVIVGPDGRYEMFSSRMARHCGLDSWATNSECVLASSDSPSGPFQVDGIAIPALCHNPTVRRLPGGDLLLYSIGQQEASAQQVTSCDGGVTTGPVSEGLEVATCVIRVGRASSVAGPFADLTELTNAVSQPVLCPTNPAPVIEADGEVRMFFRAYASYDESTGQAVEKLYAASQGSWDSALSDVGPPVLDGPAEDPFVWADARRGTWHALYNDKFSNPVNVGGHAVSTDGSHFTALAPAYSLHADMADGTALDAARRERPQVLWEDPCHGVLYTGIEPSSASDAVSVLATPIGASN